MAYYREWQTVATWLAQRGAQKVAVKGAAVAYWLPADGKYVRVVRDRSGYMLTVHESRASCGCG